MPETASVPPSHSFRQRLLAVGAAACVLLVVPFASFELDSFSVPKELVLHALALVGGLVLVARPGALRLGRVDALLLAFLAAGLVSALFAQNGWNAGRALALSASGVLVFWIARSLAEPEHRRRVLHVAAGMAVLAGLTALMQAYGLDLPLFSEERAPGGTLGNRNSVGHLAAMGVPVVVWAGFQARGLRGVLLAGLGLAVLLAALVLTRSRAGWLGAGMGLVVLLAGLVVVVLRHRPWRLVGRLLVVAGFGVLGVGAALVLPNTLRWASSDPYAETAQNVLNYREGSGQGRLLQYQTSLRLLATDPILGVGPGNWPVAYPGVARPGNPALSPREAGRTTNPWPSSDLVAVLVERGAVGAVLWGLVLVVLAIRGLGAVRSAATGAEALDGVVLLAVLGATVTVGAFDAVLLLSWPTLLFWLAVGALWPATTPVAGRWSRGRPVVVAVLVAAAGLGLARSAGQLAAMAVYDSGPSRAALEAAARMDPGNYRLRLRLGRDGNRAARCPHARAAEALFPHAAAARTAARRCP